MNSLNSTLTLDNTVSWTSWPHRTTKWCFLEVQIGGHQSKVSQKSWNRSPCFIMFQGPRIFTNSRVKRATLIDSRSCCSLVRASFSRAALRLVAADAEKSCCHALWFTLAVTLWFAHKNSGKLRFNCFGGCFFEMLVHDICGSASSFCLILYWSQVSLGPLEFALPDAAQTRGLENHWLRGFEPAF